LAAIFVEAHGIGVNLVVAEQPLELLLLLRRRGAPIGAEHEARQRLDIEALVEELLELLLALLLRAGRGQDIDRALAEIADEARAIVRRNGRAGTGKRAEGGKADGNQGSTTRQDHAGHHVLLLES